MVVALLVGCPPLHFLSREKFLCAFVVIGLKHGVGERSEARHILGVKDLGLTVHSNSRSPSRTSMSCSGS